MELSNAHGIARINCAEYFVLPGRGNNQITSILLESLASQASGSIDLKVSEDASDAALSVELFQAIANCFPKTEHIVESLHDEGSDSDDSATPTPAPPPRPHLVPARLVHSTAGDLVVRAEFSGRAPGDSLLIFMAVQQPRLVCSSLCVADPAGTGARCATVCRCHRPAVHSWRCALLRKHNKRNRRKESSSERRSYSWFSDRMSILAV